MNHRLHRPGMEVQDVTDGNAQTEGAGEQGNRKKETYAYNGI